MVGVGRDLRRSSSPNTLPKQVPLQQAAQDLIQAETEYLQRRRIHNPSGQPVAGLRHPQREEILPHIQTEFPLIQFVPVAPYPVTGHHWRVWPHPPDTHPSDICKIPSQSPLLQVKQAQLPQPFLTGLMLQSPSHLHSPPLDSLQQLLIFLELGSPELDTVLQMGPHYGSVEG